jgi:hypothetical protein
MQTLAQVSSCDHGACTSGAWQKFLKAAIQHFTNGLEELDAHNWH